LKEIYSISEAEKNRGAKVSLKQQISAFVENGEKIRSADLTIKSELPDGIIQLITGSDI